MKPLIKWMPVLALVTCFLYSSTLFSAPSRFRYEEGNEVAFREIRDGIDDIRHEIDNHEAELRMCDERIKNQETILESLRDQISSSVQANKEILKTNTGTVEGKMNALEKTLKDVVADLHQFKTHANESSEVLSKYKEKIVELEKIIEQQNANISHLQVALASLVDALQIKNTSIANKNSAIAGVSTKTYRVKNGDMLEKIARQHHTTVKMIKELNGLIQDRIKVGQILQLPED